MTPTIKALAGVGLAIALIAIVIAIVKKLFWLGLVGFGLYFFTVRLPRMLKGSGGQSPEEDGR